METTDIARRAVAAIPASTPLRDAAEIVKRKLEQAYNRKHVIIERRKNGQIKDYLIKGEKERTNNYMQVYYSSYSNRIEVGLFQGSIR